MRMNDKSVIFLNRRSDLPAIARPSHARFLMIEDHSQAGLLKRDLLAAGAVEIDRPELYRKEGGTFRTKYVDFLGALNIRNASFKWWTFNFTSKNYFVNELCRQIFHASLIIRLAEDDANDLVVIVDDPVLADFVKAVLTSRGRRVIHRVRSGLLEILRRSTRLGILYCLIAKVRTAMTSRALLRAMVIPSRRDCLMITLLGGQSFDSPVSYRDTYFGSLHNYLQQENVTCLTAGAVFTHDPATLQPLRQSGTSDLAPLDAFTPIGELIRWAFRCVAMYSSVPSVQGDTTFDGIDVAPLISQCMKREIGTGNVLLNVWFYLTSRVLAKRIAFRAVLYPFENRSWEKMLVLAFREGTACRLIGYQHASITPRHSSLLFSENEWDATPVPDLVVTTGEIPAQMLVKIGRYPERRVRAGVALRQPSARGKLREGRGEVQKILVILSSSLEEYVKSLLVLNEGLRSNDRYEIVLRTHPTIPLSAALERVPPMTFRYRQSSKASAAEDLQEADVVCYTSSTVALEAMSLGIPLVYLDLGDFMDPDPLFDFTDLKWSVRNPSEILPTLDRIGSLPLPELQKRRLSAQAYAVSYTRPADAAGLREFMDLALSQTGAHDEVPQRVFS